MESLIFEHTGSFSILVGFLFFIFLASRFNHIRMSKVGDRSVAGLYILMSALCGTVISVMAYVLATLFHH
jgi:hypothetical protein